MKIHSIEVQTDLGRRFFQISPPLDVDLTSEMHPHFRSFTEALWNKLREIAILGPAIATMSPKAEA